MKPTVLFFFFVFVAHLGWGQYDFDELKDRQGLAVFEQNDYINVVIYETGDTILFDAIDPSLTIDFDEKLAYINTFLQYPLYRLYSFWLFVIVYIGFWVNIYFFLKWAKKQPGSDEVFLYNVNGKYTYFNVLLWLDRLEEMYKKPLTKERKKIEDLYNKASKANKAISIYKNKIHDILLIKAFGPKMIRTAFSRMKLYSKVVFIWNVAIPLLVFNIFIQFFSIIMGQVQAAIVGVIIGIMVAAPLWLAPHLVLNDRLKSLLKKNLNKSSGPGLRILMAHFYGVFGGVFWRDMYWIDGKSNWLVGPDWVNIGIYTSWYGSSSSASSNAWDGFDGGDFGGGGAGGDW